MKYFLSLIIIFYHSLLFTQSKQDYVWLFGLDKSSSATDLGYKIDFKIKPFTVLKSNIGITFNSANASLCDKDGSLLFYTNGCAVLNRNAEIMPNGDSLSYDKYWDISGWNNCALLGYPAFHDFLILDDPGNADQFYIIQKPYIFESWEKYSQKYIWYSKVDMDLDNGLGDITGKNINLYSERESLSSYLTAIRHANGKDWWILQPIQDSNIYVRFLLDEMGIHKETDQSIGKVFDWNASASGTAKFSPDGLKYAYYNESDGLLLFDFDRSTGLLSNYKRVVPYDTTGQGIFCSVEWSSNSRFIYTATMTKLHQIDTWEENLQDGIRLIDTYNGTVDPFPTIFFLMALAPDCRIYMCPTSSTRSYHVINHPDSLGTACDFVQNGVKLPAYSGGGFPNFPRFRVDEVEKCDPTIVSVFGDYVWYRRDIKVWPNPSSGVFNVELPDVGAGKLVISNINGHVVYEHEVSNIIKDERIDISRCTAGRYNVEFYPKRLEKERVFYGVQVVKSEP